MILGVGVDILHVPRLAAIVRRRGIVPLASRILHPSEHVALNELKDDEDLRLRFLAVRWAVKEAAFKAVQPHFQPTWKHVSFLAPPDSHKPVLLYKTPEALYCNGELPELHASISHDGEYLTAFVVAEHWMSP